MPPFNERPDVLDAPDSDAAAKLYGLGKAAGADAFPPRALADWNRPARAQDRRQPDKAGCR